MASVLQTPPRPGPGRYPQTPALRGSLPPPPSFTSSLSQTTYPSLPQSSTSLTKTQPTEPPVLATRQTETLLPAQRASKAINEALVNETKYPELDTYLSQGYSSEYDIHASSTWAPFQKVRMHNIPDQIFEQYNRAQVSTSMGLFAELRYAWVAIDNALYLWDYTANNPELLGFEAQPHSITAVRLAVPREGVFLPNIKHMIVLATTSEIILLGLGTDVAPGSPSGLTLFQTGMSVSVKGLDTTVIGCSAKSGRVFFGGRTENELYELKYQPQDGWFSSKCAKVCLTTNTTMALVTSFTSFGSSSVEYIEQIVVDDSRDLLYTLSSKSAIRVFHLKDGKAELLLTKQAKETYANIGHIITQTESLNPRVKIVSISAIPKEEAARYILVATTATGYRIYLSAASSGYYSSNSSNAPSSVQAQHVRTPPLIPLAPGDQAPGPHTPVQYLTITRLAQRYPPGYFFCFTAKDANSPVDQLFVSAPDAARLARPPEAGQPANSREPATWISINSRAEDIGLCIPYSAPVSVPAGYGNDVAVQYDKPTPEVAILTNTGIHVIKRRRLVDIFAALIRQGGGPDGFQNEVNNLIRSYGRTEILSTALAVACGQGTEVSQDRSIRINDPEVLDVARKTFIEYGGKPSINQNWISDKTMPAIDAVRPSPRHDAIARYVSRLLRSTWKALIAKEARLPNGYFVKPAIGPAKLRSVQEDLSALQKFFVANRSFIRGLSGPDDLARTSSRDDEIALQGEHRALHALVKFVSDTIEGLSFVLVLFEERVEDIVPLLPESSRPIFLKLTFEKLFSTKEGNDVAKELVKAIVNRNIAKGSNVETVAEALRRKCGSFCSADDVVIFKAQEQLKRAAESVKNVEFQRNLLNESLKLFEQVAHSLPKDYLDSAVEQYTNLSFFAGAIQLVLKVALELDKSNEALSWIADGRPELDPRKEKFEKRDACYNLIHNVLTAIETSLNEAPPFDDGRPSLAATRRNEAYDVIGRCKDEVFLTNLYDWYLAQGWYDRLLATDSSFIVTYLQRKSTDDPTYADLLAKYYGQNDQFQEAAQVQVQLAQSSFKLPLDRRIEYLSRARANASTFSSGSTNKRKQKQKLLQEVSELLDIANVQDEILQRLKDDSRMPADRRDEILGQVDGPILNVTELFNNYADNASYYDICLMIYHVADHRDSSQISQTWQQLIAKEHDVSSTAEDGPQPFEAVAEAVRSLGGKLHLSEAVFPVPILLRLLEEYSIARPQPAPAHWVVDIFLSLEIPYEQLYDTLETIHFTPEPVFVGTNRKAIILDLLYVVDRWSHDSSRVVGMAIMGSEQGLIRVEEMLTHLSNAGPREGVDQECFAWCSDLRRRIAAVIN